MSSKKEILQELQGKVNNQPADLEKFGGNPATANAERVAIIINWLIPHMELFPISFQAKIDEYITTYSEAKKGSPEGMKIFTLVEPTDKLIMETLERLITAQD